MKLEKQLDALSSLGLRLNDGVSIDDLIYSMGREAYEERPFDLILFSLGTDVEREPWGRPFCSGVWNFDTECIHRGSGDYARIVERLSQVAGQSPTYFSPVADAVNFDTGEAWLRYTLPNATVREWHVEVNNDWADLMVVSYVMSDLETPTQHFYVKDNGQAMVLFFLTEEVAAELNRLSGGLLSRFLAI